MKITYFHIFLSFISINELNAIEIGEQETNLCICSDFTYLNNQGLLVGNCLATLETQFGRRFSGQFCYVHQPHNCPGHTIPSSDLPGMEISFTACRHKKRHEARRNRAALRLLNLLGLFPNDIATGFNAKQNTNSILDIDE